MGKSSIAQHKHNRNSKDRQIVKNPYICAFKRYLQKMMGGDKKNVDARYVPRASSLLSFSFANLGGITSLDGSHTPPAAARIACDERQSILALA